MRQVATKLQELAEGPQRRDGKFRPAWPDLSCSLQHEGIEILCRDAYRGERAPCAAVRKEPDDLVPVIVNRGLTDPAFLREIVDEGVFESRFRIARQTRLRHRNGAGLPEMGQELLQHGAIASPQATSLSRTIAGEVRKASFIDVSDAQTTSIQPAVQIAKQPELIPGVDPAIPLLEEKSCEPVDMAGERPIPKTLDRPRVPEKVCRH